jgi:hypothetical protein
MTRTTTLTDRLTTLHETAERISAQLVELELDSGRRLLEATRLTGESAARWASAGAALNGLWRGQGLLEGALQRADELAGAGRTADLQALLYERRIELADPDTPAAERDLLGTSSERRSVDQLLEEMSASFAAVKADIGQITAAWERLIPQLDEAGRTLAEARRLAEALESPIPQDLGAAEQALEQLRATVTGDPLAVGADDVVGLARTAQVLVDDLTAAVALMRGFDAQVLDARERLDVLRAARRTALAACDEVALKIAGPPPSLPAEDDAAPEQALTAIGELAREGHWREAHTELAALRSRIDGLIAEFERVSVAARAPIAARNQFRSLLEAYQVKARRLGMIEDAELVAIHRQANESLYTAPTDLRLVAQLVRAYQQRLGVASHAQERMS